MQALLAPTSTVPAAVSARYKGHPSAAFSMQAIRVIAETARLTVRSLIESDVPSLAEIWADECATRFMGGPRNFDEVCASLRRNLEAAPRQLDLWPVVDSSSGLLVGDCGLLPKVVDGRDETELIYVIAPAFWGRGYATEAATAIRDYAFHDLGVVRLISLIDPAHTASERVAVKVGMRYEKETVRPSGKRMRLYAL